MHGLVRGGELGNEEQKVRRQTLALLEQHGYAGIAPQRVAQMVHPTHVEEADICDVIREMDSDLGQDTLVSQLRAHLDRPSLASRLSSLDIPVAIVGSMQDRICAQDDLIAMAEQIPDASLHFVEDSGHFIPLEAPEALVGHISNFFGADL